MFSLSYSIRRTVDLRRKAAPRTLALAGLLMVTMTPNLPAPLAGWGSLPACAAPRRDDAENVEGATKSQTIPVNLPAGAFRSKDEESIAKFADVLRKIAKAAKRDIGPVEVLVWQSGRDVKTALPRSVKALGYTYTAQDPIKSDDDKFTMFACKASGDKRSAIGMWVDHGSSLLLAWSTVTTEAEDKGASSAPSSASYSAGNSHEVPDRTSRSTKSEAAAPADASDAIVVQADASTQFVNVMGRKMPTFPAMPNLAPKPGYVRGYVKDTQGHPLKGALIGVRSTAVGGFYSGASAKTDAQGYYEIKPPWGVGHFYCAGYATDYGDLIAAFGLHPTDGSTDEFATANGVVKNWVLLSYGIGDRAKAQDNPTYCGNYYGGTIALNFYVQDGSMSKTSLPPNSRVELTLTPDGPLLDGSKGRTIIVRKETGSGFSGGLYVNNIPVGAYKVKARMVGGGALRLHETGPYGNQAFGLTPKSAVGEANLLMKVYSADPNSATAGHGHWNTFQLSLERP